MDTPVGRPEIEEMKRYVRSDSQPLRRSNRICQLCFSAAGRSLTQKRTVQASREEYSGQRNRVCYITRGSEAFTNLIQQTEQISR
jgi:hypothetical protein